MNNVSSKEYLRKETEKRIQTTWSPRQTAQDCTRNANDVGNPHKDCMSRARDWITSGTYRKQQILYILTYREREKKEAESALRSDIKPTATEKRGRELRDK